MNIVLATRNPSKAEQVQTLFSDLHISVLLLDEAGIKGEAVEDGKTLQENSMKKVQFVRERVHQKTWIMADDTGLFIAALNGEPGIYAARWAGADAKTEEITRYCMERMRNVSNRSALFQTVVVLVSPEGKEYVFDGEVHGHILEAPRVPPRPKMPYSPLFVPEGEKLSWAEMTIEHENRISHRGIAFRKARILLERIV